MLSAGIAAALVAVAVIVLVTRPSGSPVGPGSTGAPPSGAGSGSVPPGHTPLALQLTRAVPISVIGKDGQKSATAAGRAIQTRLSELYDQTLADPSSWKEGPPAGTWEVFASGIRARARQDAQAFTLGKAGPGMQQLTIGSATVKVEVLLNQYGKVEGAEANVAIDGTGQVQGSGAVQVSARADLLLSFLSGRWVITGYPDAHLDVSTAPASPLRPRRTRTRAP